jgi:hypothetical protein
MKVSLFGCGNVRRRPDSDRIGDLQLAGRLPPSPQRGEGRDSGDNPMDQDRVVKQLANQGRPTLWEKTRAGTPCQCPAIRGRLRLRAEPWRAAG